jgi:hypothetical protein
MSTAVHITWHGAQINFGDPPPYLTYAFNVLGDMEKEELRNALVLTQESAAIQILLECCLPTPQERASGSQLTALQAPQFSLPQGTVSWDRLRKVWQKFAELGLSTGRGWFLNFVGGSDDFLMQKVYLLRLMQLWVGFIMLSSKRVISSLAYNFVTKQKKCWELLVGLVWQPAISRKNQKLMV